MQRKRFKRAFQIETSTGTWNGTRLRGQSTWSQPSPASARKVKHRADVMRFPVVFYLHHSHFMATAASWTPFITEFGTNSGSTTYNRSTYHRCAASPRWVLALLTCSISSLWLLELHGLVLSSRFHNLLIVRANPQL